MAEFIPLTPATNPSVVPVADSIAPPAPRARRPEWLRAKMPAGENYEDVRTLMREQRLTKLVQLDGLDRPDFRRTRALRSAKAVADPGTRSASCTWMP